MKNLLFIFLLFSAGLSAQTLTEARALFTEGDYEQALPVFERELRRKPKDANLNYWYGACLYHTGKQTEALPYLNTGERSKIPTASLLLAEYYHHQYQFDKSTGHIDKYIAFGLSDNSAKLARMLKSTEKAKQMLKAVEDVVFIDSLVIPKDSVFECIKLHSVNGEILPLRQLFPDQGDSMSIAYITERKDRIFYDDSTAENGWDIFSMNRMMNNWEKIDLVKNLNQPSNERFPYVLNDGITIYFASDGYNSIGGYDLFVSRYHFASESFFAPEPLPMPFNSVYNDYFYIIDEYVGRGFLVTDRYAGKDSLAIYTFLPGNTRKILSGKTEEETLDYARLASIALTQEGINTDSVRKIMKERYQYENNIEMQEIDDTESEQLRFLIRDNIVYQSENDFKSDDARQAYLQYLRMKARYNSLKTQIEADRLNYTGKDNPEQQELTTKILNAEWALLFLERDIPLKEYETRRLELKKIDPLNY
ncbi:MAG: tetratricopeptide repeat protein [Bacteroidales bacterium]|jgi:tetratricopeptide (TPR) repeat protein|nr:tetratricopeptide repeat protein [Bacteroidales bacterium]MDD2617825.1 tetratricopeptide repeat protein [Bacteroidales bacterium]MDD4641009.1 tetratricopeptide repeat protein [Bacteroidales bacterium]